MYSLPIVRAIHFWHFFTEAVGLMLSCLVHSCLVQLGKNESFVKEGLWRCFEVKNINHVWHFLLHVVAVCRWTAGQPKLLDLLSRVSVCSAAPLTYPLFSSVEGVYSLPSQWVIHFEGPEDWISTNCSSLSVCLQFGLSSCENQGSETMQ